MCTDEFAALGKRECGSLGMPDMPLIVLPHPTSTLPGAAAQARAREVVDEIIAVLTLPRRTLSARYGERIYPPPKRVLQTRQVFVRDGVP